MQLMQIMQKNCIDSAFFCCFVFVLIGKIKYYKCVMRPFIRAILLQLYLFISGFRYFKPEIFLFLIESQPNKFITSFRRYYFL